MSFDIAAHLQQTYSHVPEKPYTLKLYEFIYVSSLAAATPFTAVPQIVSRSRQYNKANDITGMLMFDGQRFAELLEGPSDVLFEVIERIRLDPRHTNIEVLHHASVEERRFVRFSMGYVPVELEDALSGLEKSEGPAAVQGFLDLIPVVDLDS
ncbi:hypothetical protein BH11PSE7_BH11PSE7_11650 [soil metagenome]